MTSNVSCLVDSLKSHRFIPGREEAEAQRPTASRGAEEHLVAVWDEGPVVKAEPMEHGLGTGFRARSVCDTG